MDERENLPAILAAQGLAATTEKRGSLVARGLVAIQESKKSELVRNSQGERYRQARTKFNRRSWRRNPVEFENPTLLLSRFKIFQKLVDENFGKAYFPLSRLYHEVGQCYFWRAGGQENKESEESHNHARHLSQMAFDWCFANKANHDAELWCDLGEMYHDKSSMYFDESSREQFNEEIRFWLAAQEDIIPDYFIGLFWAAEQECQAVYWFRKAAEQGHYYAQKALNELEIDWKK